MVYLVRHGETDWNLFKRCNGVTDTFLNKTGFKQARVLAERLSGVQFDACYCSTQTRARQFCEIIYKGDAIFDGRLAEIDCGEFEGREETPQMMAGFWQAIRTGALGTERFDVFMARNLEVCEEISKSCGEKNVLMVTHAANARVIDYFFSGKPADHDFTKTPIGKGEFKQYEGI